MTNRNIVTRTDIQTYDFMCATYTQDFPRLRIDDYLSSGNSPIASDGTVLLRENSLNRDFRRIFVTQFPHVFTSDPYYSGYLDFCDIPTSVGIGLCASVVDDATYRATSQFYSKLNTEAFNAALFFIERKQTVALLANTMTRLAEWYRSFKRGRNPFTNQDCNGRNAANYWLEYTYGWTPLISDVYSAMELQKQEPPPMWVRTSAFESLAHSGKPVSTNGCPGQFSSTELKFTGTSSSRVSIKAQFLLDDPAVVFANQLGLLNPASLVWEAMPYSFVVDWFLPIGDWLSALSSWVGLTKLQSSVTTFQVAKGELELTGNAYCGPKLNPGYADFTFVYGNRQTTSLPLPPPPRVKSPLSGSHAISALALLRQAFQ